MRIFLNAISSFGKVFLLNETHCQSKDDKDRTMVFNDPIHGHIELPDICVKIINTPEFLRLRRIKQLGATYEVYPGAAHNRFEHCIGVSFLAGEFVRHLQGKIEEKLAKQKGSGNKRTEEKDGDKFTEDMRITPEDVVCLQVAGLCHDIGHGPMSHAFEERFILKLDPYSKWTHEDASCQMFEHLLNKNKIELRREDREFVKNLIHRRKDNDKSTGRPQEKNFLYEIVSNDENGIDVDKFDYFARDCYHLGFKNNFDHKRLIKFSRVMKVDGEWHICYRDKQVEDIYHMFLSRVILHRRVCHHKTVQVRERMYMEALQKANDWYSLVGKKKTLKITESIHDMEAYATLTDNVFDDIQNSTETELKEAREILKRLNERKHYKLVSEAIPHRDHSNEPHMKFSGNFEEDETNILREILQCSEGTPKLKEEDLLVDISVFNYGRGDKNPVDSVYFYNKVKDSAFRMKRTDVSNLLPGIFSERHIRLYVRDENVREEAKKSFRIWCEKRNMNGKWKYDL